MGVQPAFDFFNFPRELDAWRSGLCDPGGIFIVVVLIILVFVGFWGGFV